jgi:hypothetical protein
VPVEDAQPYPIIDAECQWPMMSVVVSLGMFLGLKKAITDISDKGVPFL